MDCISLSESEPYTCVTATRSDLTLNLSEAALKMKAFSKSCGSVGSELWLDKAQTHEPALPALHLFSIQNRAVSVPYVCAFQYSSISFLKRWITRAIDVKILWLIFSVTFENPLCIFKFAHIYEPFRTCVYLL